MNAQLNETMNKYEFQQNQQANKLHVIYFLHLKKKLTHFFTKTV